MRFDAFRTTVFLLPAALLTFAGCDRAPAPSTDSGEFEKLISRYVEEWKGFYPARAFRMGLEEYRDREGDRSPEAVEAWVGINQDVRVRTATTPPGLPVDIRIDLRLIRRQARRELERWVETATEEEEPSFPLGRDRFAAELALYYDTGITPEELAELALAEIRTVREIILNVSREHWAEAHADEDVPATALELVERVSADMEENRPATQQESLEVFTRFAEEAEEFVRRAGIATLPSTRTLEIVNTPDSAGPAQRIGFVDSPPPFDRVSNTVLSLPTIPDTFPEAEKEAFYRSFNNHFNKAIIIHELFPGHYMQQKIASEHARPARLLFPYSPYVEGWATLVEIIALEAGWDDGNRLTYLAHLRKRLENANRAYTSVQAHCFGWDEDQVLQFSREESLVAPQFAASLYGRLQRGAMQMTSYFMGKEMFVQALEAEKDRLGEDFDMRAFSDAVLRAGAVPMDMIPDLLAETGS